PANAGGMATGNSATVLTDSETSVSQNADSSVADTPRMYPLPLSGSEKDLDLSYENGVKMLNAGQASASLVLFDEVLKNPNHHYYQDAQWEKSLALIQLNRKAEAKILLEEIVKKGGKYKSQAEAELKKL
ncbi:MAG TPA: hypothetical protein VFJ43_15595, partial [Bacteroidia bacterium]|nr:hypothetical protein [Bacteroidia bacterium]